MLDNAPASTPARPPKKPRLCEDWAPSADAGETLERSPFFPISKTGPPKADKIDMTDTILMSDDSIEEALLALPDVDSWNSTATARSTQSLTIYQDETQVTQSDSPDS